MNLEEKIKRINELYHKSQAEGLSEAELQEQSKLRAEYIANVRGNLRVQLNNIDIQNEDGTIVNPGDKVRIRKEVIKLRDALSEAERRKGSLLMTERILSHQWYYKADTLLCFSSFGSEIDTSQLIDEALRTGKSVYLPKVQDNALVFLRIHDRGELHPGYKGIMEPDSASDQYCYERETDTLMVMPGAVFDERGYRMGYGGGFYDRFLADKEVLQMHTIAVGFLCQKAEQVPADQYDIKPGQIMLF